MFSSELAAETVLVAGEGAMVGTLKATASKMAKPRFAYFLFNMLVLLSLINTLYIIILYKKEENSNKKMFKFNKIKAG